MAKGIQTRANSKDVSKANKIANAIVGLVITVFITVTVLALSGVFGTA